MRHDLNRIPLSGRMFFVSYYLAEALKFQEAAIAAKENLYISIL